MSEITPISNDRYETQVVQGKTTLVRAASALHSVSKSLHDCVMNLWAAFRETIHLQASLSLEDHLKREQVKGLSGRTHVVS